MKRLCAFLLSALMLLSLWGCSEKIPPGTSDPSTTPSATKGYLTADIPETIDYHQTVIDLMAKMPEIKPYDGEIPEPYEPGRKVFITLDNQDCDFYPGLDFNFPFSVYTLEHYDVSQIQAKFDMQSEYTVSVREITDFAVGDMGLNEYKVFFGYDFYEQEKDGRYNNCAYLLKDPYDEMLKEVRAAAYADRKAPEGLPEYQLLQKHINGYRKLCNISHEKEDALKQEYAEIPKEELPTFYLYDVCITFTGLEVMRKRWKMPLLPLVTKNIPSSSVNGGFIKRFPRK